MVTIQNIGRAAGILANVGVRGAGGSFGLTVNQRIDAGARSSEFTVRDPFIGRAIWSIVGTDLSRRPEVVTANNVFVSVF